MITAITLTFLAVICRLCSAHFHLWNLVPMGAVALYAGARLPRRWAWLVPVAGMVISDFVLDFGSHRSVFELTRWLIYASFAAATLLGPIAGRPRMGPFMLPVLSLSTSMLFFLASNFGVWAEGLLYPMTLDGLAQCYIAAIPFFGKTIIGELVGTCFIFGVGSVIERSASAQIATQSAG